jgi:hypothetical protein
MTAVQVGEHAIGIGQRAELGFLRFLNFGRGRRSLLCELWASADEATACAQRVCGQKRRVRTQTKRLRMSYDAAGHAARRDHHC